MHGNHVALNVQVFATAGSDHAVRVYDEATRTAVATLTAGDGVKTTGHSNSVYGLAWKQEEPQVSMHV